MLEVPSTITVPFRIEETGAIRIGKSRVLLEVLITAFRQGETPEGIVESFPSLKLEDVYAVIAYYLRHRDEVDTYVQSVEEAGQRLQAEIEAQYDSQVTSLRARLRARLTAPKQIAS